MFFINKNIHKLPIYLKYFDLINYLVWRRAGDGAFCIWVESSWSVNNLFDKKRMLA